MTAQIPDQVRFRRREYALAGVLGGPLFEPASLGILPVMIHTALWRGYVATYEVRDDQLLLADLLVGPQSVVDGQVVTADTRLLGVPAGQGDYGALEFRGLQIPVAFSGGILLGRRFLPETYVHMGFHPAWRYRDVVELLFDDGTLTGNFDRSRQVAGLRRRIASGDAENPDAAADLTAWIERTFTLDYGRSIGSD